MEKIGSNYRAVIGYEGLYSVSKSGDVYSIKGGYALAPYRGCYVTLRKGGVSMRYKVADLVAAAWLPNPNGWRYVRHKNGDYEDNQVGNLEFVQKREYALSRYAKEKARKVWQINELGEVVKHYDSVAEASKKTGIAAGSIVRCCTGELKSAGGWSWRYAKV